MSYPLLTEAGKIHDIADDLESVFWVLVFAAMKWHTIPGQELPLYGFDELVVHPDGTKVGGQLKGYWIFSDELYELRYTHNVLKELIRASRLSWFQFYRARRGAPEFASMEEVRAEIMKMLDLAPSPAFWIEKYATSLSAMSTPTITTSNAAGAVESQHVTRGGNEDQVAGAVPLLRNSAHEDPASNVPSERRTISAAARELRPSKRKADCTVDLPSKRHRYS